MNKLTSYSGKIVVGKFAITDGYECINEQFQLHAVCLPAYKAANKSKYKAWYLKSCRIAFVDFDKTTHTK